MDAVDVAPQENILLSKPEADALGEQVIAEARAETLPLPRVWIAPMYRCAALQALPADAQAEVLGRATVTAGKSPILIVIVVAWFLTLAAVWTLGPDRSDYPRLTGLFIVVCSFLPLVVRTAVKAYYVRKLARSMAARYVPGDADLIS